MKQIRFIMGMPVIIEVVGKANKRDLKEVFDYFREVDRKFSPFKKNSEVSKFNRGEISQKDFSQEMAEIWRLSQEVKRNTGGFFEIQNGSKMDPSGLVKGWAINNAAKTLRNKGYQNFYINAGGDIQVAGHNRFGKPWRIGIKSPFNQKKIIKCLSLENGGVATSGTYEKGQHIYNPKNPGMEISDIVSLTVIGPDILKADTMATAAFAMGRQGIYFLESADDLEGYMIDIQGIATFTSNFGKYNLI